MEKEVIVKWKIEETQTSKILGLLQELTAKTRSEKGNIFYNIYQSEEDVNVLILHERYLDADAAQLHKESAHYQEIVVNKIIPYLQGREVLSVKKLY
jgi:autoinducer 2-degrading protein